MSMATREIADLAREIRLQILHTIKGAGMGHIRSRWVGRRLIDLDLVPQTARGDRQHAAQLPAAQNSDGRARFQHLTHPSAHPGSSLTKPRATRPTVPPAPGLKSPKSPPPSARHWPPPPPQSPWWPPDSPWASARWNKDCPHPTGPWSEPARRSPARGFCWPSCRADAPPRLHPQ